jgi:hypothetical protein
VVNLKHSPILVTVMPLGRYCTGYGLDFPSVDGQRKAWWVPVGKAGLGKGVTGVTHPAGAKKNEGEKPHL